MGVLSATTGPAPVVHFVDAADARWHLHLQLADAYEITDERDWLSPGAWRVRLIVGADDGDAHAYDIGLAWTGDEPDAQAVLNVALASLNVRPARRSSPRSWRWLRYAKGREPNAAALQHLPAPENALDPRDSVSQFLYPRRQLEKACGGELGGTGAPTDAAENALRLALKLVGEAAAAPEALPSRRKLLWGSRQASIFALFRLRGD
jgi:hypothetical protein